MNPQIWDLRLRRRIIWHLPSIIIILVGLFFTRTIRIFLPSNDSTIALTQHCISKGERVRLLKEDNTTHHRFFFTFLLFIIIFYEKNVFINTQYISNRLFQNFKITRRNALLCMLWGFTPFSRMKVSPKQID